MNITEPLILNLESITKKDIKKIGSKAANLGKLIQNDFTVPKGFVITTAAYSLFLTDNNLNKLIQDSLAEIDYEKYETIENAAKKIQEAIKKRPISTDLAEEVKSEYDKLRKKEVSVRSSAIAEDLLTASFAGQYDTFLSLKTLSHILQNIINCYASVWTSRAIAYRYENNIPHSDVKLAVIVQEMVPAKCSGVLFTINPVSSKKNELVIESNFGLGESIVSGQSSPDNFVVQKEKRHGKEPFKILNKQIGKKSITAYPKSSETESGLELVELSEQETKQSSLTDLQIIKLSQIGSQIERSFKVPQDIEWAIDQSNKIYLLQSRPITTLKSFTAMEETFWTRGYSDDYWNDPVTPLFFDILGDPITIVVNIELNSIMGYKRMEKKLLKLYNGHVYFNLDVLKNKVIYEIPKNYRNEDLLNYFPDGTGPYGKETIKNLPFKLFKRLVSELRIKSLDPDGSINKTADKYYEWSEEVFIPYCDTFDSQLKSLTGTDNLEALIKLAEDLDRTMIRHFRLIRYGIPVHNIGMNLMIQYLLTKFLGKEESTRVYPVLISGLEHKLTETNERIHHLASIIQKTPELKSLILDNKSEELYSILSSNENSKIQSFFGEFKTFLEKYGDRGFSREAFYPRWNEAPRYVFDILKSLIQGEERDFEKLKEKESRQRDKIEKLVETKIRSQLFGFVKWMIFSKILSYSRQYIVFREDQRFNIDKWFTRNRKVYLEIGKTLERSGILKEPTDIFFLHKKEIKQIGVGKGEFEISSLIKKRKDEFFKYEYTVPPKFIHGSREFDDIFQYTEDSSSFQGIPASQGIITAKIRVLNKIEEIPSVLTGEVLVVSKTDPGWTPIFSKIGGLITETGGVLSHGAVVSREYGIPAVTNIPNACQLFKTGQIVAINGYTGSVLIKK